MNKNIWIIANWKSNKNIDEALEWISEVGLKIPEKDPPAGGLKVVVCPTFSVLSEVKKAIQAGNFPIMVGSQDISPFGIGSYTGEEPAEILKLFIDISIIGHSERRHNFSENDQIVDQKVKKALENEIIPLVCVQNFGVAIPDGCKLVAYEPNFAIGTGNPDTPENANIVAGKIKEKYGQAMEVIYGGSVTPENVKGFIMQENISGILLGKASLDAKKFIKILEESNL